MTTTKQIIILTLTESPLVVLGLKILSFEIATFKRVADKKKNVL
jgi:hypothetical protein